MSIGKLEVLYWSVGRALATGKSMLIWTGDQKETLRKMRERFPKVSFREEGRFGVMVNKEKK